MVVCPRCKKEHPDGTDLCSCGMPLTKEKKDEIIRNGTRILAITFGVVFLSFVWMYFAYSKPHVPNVKMGVVTANTYTSGNFLIIQGEVVENPNDKKVRVEIFLCDSVGGEQPVDAVYMKPHETGNFVSKIDVSKLAGPPPYEVMVKWR